MRYLVPCSLLGNNALSYLLEKSALFAADKGRLRMEGEPRTVLEITEADENAVRPRAAVKRVYCMMPENE